MPVQRLPRTMRSTRTELVGGVVGGNETDVVHMRLKRMAAFDSHDYDPTDNDLEEDALRGRTRGRSSPRATGGSGGRVRSDRCGDGVIAFVIDGLVDKLNLFRYGVIGDKAGVDGMSRFVAMVGDVTVSWRCSPSRGDWCRTSNLWPRDRGYLELKTYLNGVHLKGLLRLKTVVAKLGGISFSIGAGLIAGKEGLLAARRRFSRWRIERVRIEHAGFQVEEYEVVSKRPSQTRLSPSTATGVAWFRRFIGGMLFTVEEGLVSTTLTCSGAVFLATCTGVLTMHWLEQLDFDAGDFARARFWHAPRLWFVHG